MKSKKMIARSWQILGVFVILLMVVAMVVPSVMAQEEPAMVTVYHGINGKSAGARILGDPKALPKDLTVDVYVTEVSSTIPVIDDFKFRDTEGPLPLPAGTYNIRVVLDAGTPLDGLELINQDVSVSAGDEVLIRAKLQGKRPPFLDVKVK